jgi:y4mF family transcriptional regulator
LPTFHHVGNQRLFSLSAIGDFAITSLMEIHSVRELAAVIRSLRREKGWTQAALAQAAGVGREWIIHLEKARPGVELGLVMATLKALGVRLRIEPPSPVESDIDLSQILDESKPPTSAP